MNGCSIAPNGGGCVFARPLGEIHPLLPTGGVNVINNV